MFAVGTATRVTQPTANDFSLSASLSPPPSLSASGTQVGEVVQRTQEPPPVCVFFRGGCLVSFVWYWCSMYVRCVYIHDCYSLCSLNAVRHCTVQHEDLRCHLANAWKSSSKNWDVQNSCGMQQRTCVVFVDREREPGTESSSPVAGFFAKLETCLEQTHLWRLAKLQPLCVESNQWSTYERMYAVGSTFDFI